MTLYDSEFNYLDHNDDGSHSASPPIPASNTYSKPQALTTLL